MGWDSAIALGRAPPMTFKRFFLMLSGSWFVSSIGSADTGSSLWRETSGPVTAVRLKLNNEFRCCTKAMQFD